MRRIASLIARWLAPYIVEEITPALEPLANGCVITRQLVVEEITSALEPLAHGHVITRQMVEDLANHLGYEITFDLQTGAVTIHDLKR